MPKFKNPINAEKYKNEIIEDITKIGDCSILFLKILKLKNIIIFIIINVNNIYIYFFNLNMKEDY